MYSPVVQSTSRTTNMESKSKKSSNVLLFGLSFNLILTLSSLGFTCYSLHRLDSRLTAVERDLLAVNSYPYQLANREIVTPKTTHSPQSGSQRKEAIVKRAADRPSLCRKCSSVCPLNANGQRNVSYLCLICYSKTLQTLIVKSRGLVIVWNDYPLPCLTLLNISFSVSEINNVTACGKVNNNNNKKKTDSGALLP